MVEGAQVLDAEGDMLPVVVKGDEPASEEEQAPTLSESVELETMVIEKVKGISKPSSPLPPRCRCSSFDLARGPDQSPTAASIHEAGDVTGVLRQRHPIGAASTLAPMLATTAGALETWLSLPHGVSLPGSSAILALATFARVGGKQQRQSGTSEVEMAELNGAIGKQQAPILLGSVKKENVSMGTSEVKKVQAPVIVG